MLDIVDYRVDGRKLRVRLKCSCGDRRILKMKAKDETVYECAKCHARAPLRKLRDAATIYWQGRPWEIECEDPAAERKSLESTVVRYPATLDAKQHRYAQPYCSLTGHCVELGPTGLVFSAKDFRREYFAGMSTDYRFATVQFPEGIRGLPPLLRGSIIQIKFHEEALPNCDVRIAFQYLSDDEQAQLLAHLENLRGRITEWSIA